MHNIDIVTQNKQVYIIKNDLVLKPEEYVNWLKEEVNRKQSLCNKLGL